MPRHPLAWLKAVLLAAAVLLVSQQPAAAADKGEKSAAELLPASTLVYAEVSQPKELIGLVLDHPMLKKLEESPEYRQALETPQFKEFRDGIALIEKRAGVEWRQALETMTGGGIVIAIDPPTQGGILLIRSEDPKTTEKVRDTLLAIAWEDAAAKGKPAPVETKQYRGLTAHKAGEATMASLGSWLMVTNKPDLAKTVADLYLDGGESLAGEEEFAQAKALATAGGGGAKPTGWAYVKLAQLKLLAAAAPEAQPFLNPQAKADNPGAEFLLGGVIPAIQKAPYVVATTTVDKQTLKLAVKSPFDPAWVPEQRQFFFAPAGQNGGAEKPLRPKGTLLSITAYRDTAAMWQAGPELFTEGVAGQLAQTDAGLSTFFGGKSFSGDVLPAFAPQMQFIVARQDFKAAGVPAPTIRLPGFAWVFRLKKEEAKAVNLRKHMRVAFQSVVALGNLDGATKNRPMLDMQTEKRGEAEIHFATYEPDEPDEGPADPDAAAAAAGKPAAEEDLHYNFSPAMVVSGDYLMLCSTRQIAVDLADLAARQKKPTTIPENTLVEFDAKGTAEVLRENREQLIAQNMLEKGHGPEAAAKEVDLLLALVEYFQSATVRLTPAGDSLTFEVEVKAAPPQTTK